MLLECYVTQGFFDWGGGGMSRYYLPEPRESSIKNRLTFPKNNPFPENKNLRFDLDKLRRRFFFSFYY